MGDDTKGCYYDGSAASTMAPCESNIYIVGPGATDAPSIQNVTDKSIYYDGSGSL